VSRTETAARAGKGLDCTHEWATWARTMAVRRGLVRDKLSLAHCGCAKTSSPAAGSARTT